MYPGFWLLVGDGIAGVRASRHTQVTATEEDLLASLFGDQPAAEALLAFAGPSSSAGFNQSTSTPTPRSLARRGMYRGGPVCPIPVNRRRSLGFGTLATAARGSRRGGARLRSLRMDVSGLEYRRPPFLRRLGRPRRYPNGASSAVHGDALRQLAEGGGTSAPPTTGITSPPVLYTEACLMLPLACPIWVVRQCPGTVDGEPSDGYVQRKCYRSGAYLA